MFKRHPILRRLAALALAAVCCVLFFHWSNTAIQTERFTFASPRLPEHFDGFTIVLLSDLHGAVFLDAGNVWLLRPDAGRPDGAFTLKKFPEQIALGTGLGLRYDLDFLVFRLDCGVGLHDPSKLYRNGYYNIGKFKDGLALHFAIGYPF